MNARGTLEALYARFGPPDMTNVVPSELPQDVDYRFGAFALADHEGSVVLIRRKPIAAYPGIEDYWWIPGGAQEADEPLDETAKRELAEEAAVQVTIDRILLVHINPDWPSFVAVTFRGRVVDGTVSASADPDGATLEAKTFPPRGVPFDRIWMELDRILLVREGFAAGSIGDLLAKNGLSR